MTIFWPPTGASASPATKPMSSAHSQPLWLSMWKPSTLRRWVAGSGAMALPSSDGKAVRRAGPPSEAVSSRLRVAGASEAIRRGVLTKARPLASKWMPAMGALTELRKGAAAVSPAAQVTPL